MRLSQSIEGTKIFIETYLGYKNSMARCIVFRSVGTATAAGYEPDQIPAPRHDGSLPRDVERHLNFRFLRRIRDVTQKWTEIQLVYIYTFHLHGKFKALHVIRNLY